MATCLLPAGPWHRNPKAALRSRQRRQGHTSSSVWFGIRLKCIGRVCLLSGAAVICWILHSRSTRAARTSQSISWSPTGSPYLPGLSRRPQDLPPRSTTSSSFPPTRRSGGVNLGGSGRFARQPPAPSNWTACPPGSTSLPLSSISDPTNGSGQSFFTMSCRSPWRSTSSTAKELFRICKLPEDCLTESGPWAR